MPLNAQFNAEAVYRCLHFKTGIGSGVATCHDPPKLTSLTQATSFWRRMRRKTAELMLEFFDGGRT